MDFSINGMKKEKKEIREIHMQNRRLVEIQISVLAKQTDIWRRENGHKWNEKANESRGNGDRDKENRKKISRTRDKKTKKH